MSESTQAPRAKWPMVIAVVSVLYALLYAALYLRRPASEVGMFARGINIAACLLLFLGALGAGWRRRWAVPALLSGSVLVLIVAGRAFISIVQAMGGGPPVVMLFGMLTFMLPTVFWPVFLLVWFSRGRIKATITREDWA